VGELTGRTVHPEGDPEPNLHQTSFTSPARSVAAVTAMTQRARRMISRVLGVPPPTTGYHVERRVPVPMRDGVILLADHYVPDTATPVGTLLIRGPYGRDFPFSSLTAGVYAARGYHVVLQSVRGTFGSGGVFDPPVNEAADGIDTVAWLREQPWYTGSFGTVGQSYLGQTQFALLEDPAPDHVAAVIIVGVHNFAMSSWGTGAFAVNDFLGWSNTVAHQEDPRRLLTLVRQIRARAVVERTATQVPLGAAGRALLGNAAPWWEKWLEHSDPGDEFWQNHIFVRGLESARVPVLLIGGWQDIFLEQTLEQYRRLHDRNVEVALTIGPWTHTSMMARAAAVTLRESLDWLGTHVGGRPAAPRRPVRVYVTGGRRAPGWLELPSWPPATAPRVFFTEPGRLLDAVSDGAATRSSFTFDPHDPTPTVGGRLLSPAGGYRRDEKLAERGDVLGFTSEPLPQDLYVYGAPVL